VLAGAKVRAVDVRRTVDFSLAFLLYVLLALAVDSPFLFFNQSLYLADITYNIEPAARYMRAVWLQTGAVPLWNPDVLCGAPQWQLIWPLFYLPGQFFLFAPFPLATGMFLLFHQVAAGLAGFVWQYRNQEIDWQPLRWFPPLLFGLVFMLSGYMAGSTINLSLFACAAWLPAALLAIDSLTVKPRLWCVALLGCLIGLQITAGRPEIFLCSFLLYLAYAVFRILRLRPSVHGVITIAGSFVLATVLGLLLSAVDLYPLAELAGQAPPVGKLLTLGMNYWSAGWFDFLGLALSQPVGPLAMTSYNFYPSYPGSSQYLTSMYVGPPVLTLAICGLADRGWNQRWFWLAILVLFTALSAGEFGPILTYVHQAVPDQMAFRFPIKLSIFVILALAASAAAGARVLLDGGVNRMVLLSVGALWFVSVVVGLIPLMLSDPSFLGLLPGSQSELSTPGPWRLTRASRLSVELALAGLAGILTCLTFFPSIRRIGSKHLSVAVLGMLSGVLLIVNATNHLWNTVDGSFFESKSALAERLRKDASVFQGQFRVMSLFGESDLVPPVVRELSAAKIDPAFMQYARIVLMPNCSIGSGIILSNGVSTVPSWQSYFLATGLLPRSSLRTGSSHPAGDSDLPLLRYCQASSTRYLLTSAARRTDSGAFGDGQLAEPLPYLDGKLFKLVEEDAQLNLRIYRIDELRPRVSLMSRFQAVGSRIEALTLINRCDGSGYDPLHEILISPLRRQKLGVESITADTQAGTVKLTADSADRLCLSAEVNRPAFVVLTDSYNPGWKAYDNGKPAEVYQADGLFMAVYVEPGRHEILLVFKPDSLAFGGLLSQAGLLLTVLLLSTAAFKKLR
jgi:hypothetical protein